MFADGFLRLEHIFDTELHRPIGADIGFVGTIQRNVVAVDVLQSVGHLVLKRIVVGRRRLLRDGQELILLTVRPQILRVAYTPVAVEQVEEVVDVETESQLVLATVALRNDDVVRNAQVELIGEGCHGAVALGVLAAVLAQIGVLLDELVHLCIGKLRQ